MRITAAAVAVTALFATSAVAQSAAKPSWYVSGGIGYAKTSPMATDQSLAVPGATSSDFTYHGTNTSAKAALGFNFNRYVALEGSYVDFGKYSARRDVLAPTTGTVDVNWKVSGFGLAVRGGFPITDRWFIYGKVGTARLTTDLHANDTLTPASSAEKNSRWSLMYGAGMDFDLTSNLGLRAEWEMYKNATNTNVVNINGGAFDYNTFFGSVYYRF